MVFLTEQTVEADLGEADGRRNLGVDGGLARRGDRHREFADVGLGEGHRLAHAGGGVGPERNELRRAAVDADRCREDGSVGRRRLEQGDVVGAHGPIGAHGDRRASRVGAADPPRRAGITVERSGGAVLGARGAAVGGRVHFAALLLDDGAVGVGRVGEHVERERLEVRVGRVWPARSVAPLLCDSDANQLAGRRRLLSVRISAACAARDWRGLLAVSELRSSTSWLPSIRPAAAASTMPSPSPARTTGSSVGAVCTIGTASWTSNSATDGGRRLGGRRDSVRRARARRALSATGPKVLRCVESGGERVGEVVPEHLRLHETKALVLQIAAHRHRADAEEARHRRGDAGSKVPSCMRRSMASSRFTVCGEP